MYPHLSNVRTGQLRQESTTIVSASRKTCVVVSGRSSVATADALLLEVLQIERESLLRLRNEAAISDDVVRTIQRDLDILESHVHTGSTENALRQHF